jgi:enediyne biosynthesis protein E4
LTARTALGQFPEKELLDGPSFFRLSALPTTNPEYPENQGGKKFVEKTAQYFPKTPWGAMGIKFFDYDNDGRMDLFIADMHSDMSQEPGPENEKLKSQITWTDAYIQGTKSDFIWGNALYHNLGNGKFEEVSDRLGVETYWPWGPSVGDLNADGWDNIFIASGMSYPYRYGINSLLLNDHGKKFLDAEFVLGIEPRKNLYTPWFEIDCSDPQERQAQGKLDSKVCVGQSGKSIVMAPRSSRSSVIFDLDNDGDLDIVTNDFNSEPQILISDLAQRRPIRWLKVVLERSNSNRNGIGATVRVQAGGQTHTKYNDGKSGYLAQSVCRSTLGWAMPPKSTVWKSTGPLGGNRWYKPVSERIKLLLSRSRNSQSHDNKRATVQRSASLRWRREPRLRPTITHLRQPHQ